MKNTQKILIGILTLFTCITYTIPVKASTEDLKTETINELLTAGVSEDEINKLGEEGLSDFYNNDILKVDTKYFAVDDTTGKITPSTEQEVEKAVQEDKKQKLIERDKLMATFGTNKEIKLIGQGELITPFATNTATSSGGYLRQSIYVSKPSSGSSGDYNVALSCEWILLPENRLTDVFGIGLSSNLDAVQGSQKIWHKVYYTDHNLQQYYGGQNDLSPSKWGEGLVAKVNLYDDTLTKFYHNEYVYMSFDVKLHNASDTSFSVNGNYRHQESTFEVSPGVSGISFTGGISVTYSTKMHEMLPNAYVNYTIN